MTTVNGISGQVFRRMNHSTPSARAVPAVCQSCPPSSTRRWVTATPAARAACATTGTIGPYRLSSAPAAMKAADAV